MSEWKDYFDVTANYPSGKFVSLLELLKENVPLDDPFYSVISDTYEWALPIVHPRLKFLFIPSNGISELYVALAINKSDPGFNQVFLLANDLAIAMNPQRWFHLAHDAITRQPERLVVVSNILEELGKVLDGYKFPTPQEFRSFIAGLNFEEEFDPEPFIVPEEPEDTDDQLLQ